MELEDKVYFLEDILDELEKDGYNKDMVREGYYLFRERLLKDLDTTDNLTYKLGTLGLLHFTVSSLTRLKGWAQRIVEKGEREGIPEEVERGKHKLQNILQRQELIREKIKVAQEKGIKKIQFFRRRFDPKNIKNDKD